MSQKIPRTMHKMFLQIIFFLKDGNGKMPDLQELRKCSICESGVTSSKETHCSRMATCLEEG